MDDVHVAFFSPFAKPNAEILKADRLSPVTLEYMDALEFIFRLTLEETLEDEERVKDIVKRATIDHSEFHRVLTAACMGKYYTESHDPKVWQCILELYVEMARERKIPDSEVTKGYLCFLNEGPQTPDEKVDLLMQSGVELTVKHRELLSTCISDGEYDIARSLIAAGVPKKFAYKQSLLRNPKYRTALLNVMM
jgi:hypothetical protein